MEKTRMLFSLALASILLFVCPLTEPAQPNTPPLPPSAPSPPPVANISPSPPPPTADDTEAQWALITKGNVEQVCLSEAKKEAVKSGYDAGVVFSCGCSSQEGSDTKSYSCQVSALDGNHPVSIDCSKSARICRISSEQGDFSYSFEQLQAMRG